MPYDMILKLRRGDETYYVAVGVYGVYKVELRSRGFRVQCLRCSVYGFRMVQGFSSLGFRI